MKSQTRVQREWWCEIHEPDYEINILCGSEDAIEHVKRNGPSLIGTVILDGHDHARAIKYFKDKDVASIGVSWNKYAKQLGLDPI